MTTTNAAAVDKTTEKNGMEKASEKLAEKRRALGRGLESLLPGPRVVPAAPTLPQSARKDGAPDASSQFPVLSSQRSDSLSPSSLSSSSDGGRAGTPVAPPNRLAVPGTLDELASAAGQTPDGEHAFELELDLDQIDQNPHQTRMEFDPQALGDLAGSIQTQGVLQPIVVRPRGGRPGVDGLGSKERFILILGERRFRASKMAGKTTIPAIVKRVSEQQAAEMTLVENLQRQDLDCLEQAAAFANLSTEFHLTQEQIGNRVGVSREQVSNYLRLLKLPPEVLAALRRKDLTYSHARVLLSLSDDSQISKVARVAIAKKMSVALLAEMVMDKNVPTDLLKERHQSGARWVDPNVRAAQRSLEAVLGMRVRIRDRRGKGKILIEYGTLEDFDRVVQMLKGKVVAEPGR
jgi:ParB family transcriptional regulator, chromosome partitioning protein